MRPNFISSLNAFSKKNFSSTLVSRNQRVNFTTSLYHTRQTNFAKIPLYQKYTFSTNVTHQHKIAHAEVLHIDSAPPITPNEISNSPFPDHVLSELSKGFDENEVEIKPDGIIYLPEIKYRRVLNNAFGAGGWVMIPRGAPAIRGDILYREYAMYCYGKYVSQAVGEQQIHKSMSEGTAVESSKSNALMRCCKDLGIASELWDPNFIEGWKSAYAIQVWCKNEKTGELRLLWRRKDRSSIAYPWKEQTPLPIVKKIPPPPPPRITPSHPLPPPSQNIPLRKQTQSSQPPSAPRKKRGYVEEVEEEQALVEEEIHEEVEENNDGDMFDPTEIVPPELKRFRDKTWEDVFQSPEGLQYLNWAFTHPKLTGTPKQKVSLALEYYNRTLSGQGE